MSRPIVSEWEFVPDPVERFNWSWDTFAYAIRHPEMAGRLRATVTLNHRDIVALVKSRGTWNPDASGPPLLAPRPRAE